MNVFVLQFIFLLRCLCFFWSNSFFCFFWSHFYKLSSSLKERLFQVLLAWTVFYTLFDIIAVRKNWTLKVNFVNEICGVNRLNIEPLIRNLIMNLLVNFPCVYKINLVKAFWCCHQEFLIVLDLLIFFVQLHIIFS